MNFQKSINYKIMTLEQYAEITININTVALMVHNLAKEKGWYDKPETEDQFIARSTANFHAEVSELWEAHRNNCFRQECDKAHKMRELGITPLTCAEEELADLVIRAFDSAEHLGINIGSAIARKHAFNQSRPYRHGGKAA